MTRLRSLWPCEGFGDALGVLALAVHAESHGGQAAIEHPALVGLQDVAEHAAAAAESSG